MTFGESLLGMATPKPKPSRNLTPEEIRNNPVFRKALDAQKNPADALTGELGLFANPDGTNSSERSATREFNGQFVNFPLLVKGQSRAAVQRILRGESTPEDEDLAFQRFLARIRGGLSAPSFSSMEAAVVAAGKRSDEKE